MVGEECWSVWAGPCCYQDTTRAQRERTADDADEADEAGDDLRTSEADRTEPFVSPEHPLSLLTSAYFC